MMGPCTFRTPRLPRRCAGAAAVLLLVAWPLAAQSTRPAGTGALIPIRGVIDDIQRDSLERRIEEARAAGADTLVFDLDTPGGLVSSALDICALIERQGDDVRTVAWVNPQALSAGAMISVSCDEIWMSPSSSLGDCAPIMIVPLAGPQELGETERAKAESPILQRFRDAAARNGYSQLLSRAMVTMGEEVWWLEKMDDPQERRFVSGPEKQELIDEVEPSERVWRLVSSYQLPGERREVPVTQPVDRADSLLTMGENDAVAFGFARGIARNVEELTTRLGLAAPPAQLDVSGWESFATWLNDPLVRGLLLIIVFVAGYMELQSPGLIVPGAVALVALAVFLAAPYAAGLASIWTIAILVLGLLLLAAEILVIPGFGVAGVLGVILILIGVIGSFVPAEPSLPTFSLPNLQTTWDGIVTGIKVLMGSLAISVAGILLLVKYLPQSPAAVGVLTDNPENPALAVVDASAAVAQVGDVGVVTGDLRPGGQARFGQEIVDVSSQSGYVEAGRRVQVIRREGMSIVVRPLPEEHQA